MVLLPRPIDDGVIGAYGNVATVGIDPYVPQELRDTDGYLGPTNAVEAENASADAIAVAFGTHRVDPIRAGAIDAEKALLALMHDARSDAIEMQNHMRYLKLDFADDEHIVGGSPPDSIQARGGGRWHDGPSGSVEVQDDTVGARHEEIVVRRAPQRPGFPDPRTAIEASAQVPTLPGTVAIVLDDGVCDIEHEEVFRAGAPERRERVSSFVDRCPGPVLEALHEPRRHSSVAGDEQVALGCPPDIGVDYVVVTTTTTVARGFASGQSDDGGEKECKHPVGLAHAPSIRRLVESVQSPVWFENAARDPGHTGPENEQREPTENMVVSSVERFAVKLRAAIRGRSRASTALWVRRRRAFYCHRRRTNAPSGTSTREGGPLLSPNVHTKTLVGDGDSCSVSSWRRF